MEVLTSRSTFFIKRVFPLLWVALLLAFLVSAFANDEWNKDPFFIVAPILMIVIGFVAFRSMIWNLADEVRDGGDFLRVRRGSLEERVPLADVVNVGVSQFTNPQRISLRLRTRGKFGDEIAFLPRQPVLQFNPMARNEIAESLIKRVDAARRGEVR